MTHRVVLSGGLDSTSALALTLSHAKHVETLSFEYGQRHRKEVDAARQIAAYFGVPHSVLYIGNLLHGSALKGDGDVPHGHYAEESMRATVVNGRNLIFAAAAVGASVPGDTLVFGVHAGDHPIYPDCRPEFWDRLRAITEEAYDVRIETPFLRLDKATLVRIGEEHGAPFAHTWSCYEGGEQHCGRCGTCVERAEAFALAVVPDPTAYADPHFWKETVAP